MYQYKICFVLAAIAVLMISLVLPQYYLILILSSSAIAWVITYILIPKIAFFMINADVFGYDINKKGSEMGNIKIPECVGFSAAISFVIVNLFYYSSENYITHLACLLTIVLTILLGFVDDMLDIQWRYKLIFPFFFMIPVIRVFTGSTAILMPYPISLVVGDNIDISYFFYVYITLLGIYCTNAINIYAGINGLQVGQSIVSACSLLILFGVRSLVHGHPEKYEYSSFLLICFLGSSLALMKQNAYPAKIFVGDTYCYFAGIVFAISAMYSQTAIVCQFLFLPQLINFLYSIPQLLGFYECPRHRLPVYNSITDKLTAKRTNMNLLNLSLRVLGATNEGVLCDNLLIFQIVMSGLGIAIGVYFV